MGTPVQIGLFEGYGGLTRAVTNTLGAELIAYSEIEPAACRLLEHHHPDVPNLGDITAIDWTSVPRDTSRPLVLTGGFPCQDVSSAGRRRGIRPGTRSGLWAQMAYAIDQLRPELVVIENVRGLLSADAACDVEPCPWCLGDNEGRPLRALGAVLGDLANLGYDTSWCGLRAADVGAPHGRFRVFITAWPAADSTRERRDEGWTEPARLVRGHDAALGGVFAPADANRLGSARAGAARERRAGSADHDLAAPNPVRDGREGRTERHLGQEAGQSTPLRRDSARRVLVTTCVADERNAPSDAKSDGEQQEHPSDDGFTGEWSPVRRGAVEPAGTGGDRAARGRGEASTPTRGRGDAGSDSTHSAVAWGEYAPAIARWELILGRPAPAPTQVGARGGRQLSPLFVEWMQGLPEGWVTGVPGLSRNEQLKMLGNGVVPQQAEAALLHMLAANVTERAA